MKLFSTTTTLLAVMISSTMLLSACKDGSTGSSDRVLISNDGTSTTVKPTTGSDSSGKKDDKKDTPKKDDKKDEPSKDKPSKLVGYWKGECESISKGSMITYLKFTTYSDKNVVTTDAISKRFSKPNCKGSPTAKHEGTTEPVKADELAKNNINVVGSDTFKTTTKDGSNTFTRVSEKEYYETYGLMRKPKRTGNKEANKIVGYWKSQCIESTVRYMNVTKNDYDQFLTSEKYQKFANEKCTGDFKVEKDKEHEVISLDFVNIAIDVINDNSFKIDPLHDNKELNYNRISKAEFDAVK